MKHRVIFAASALLLLFAGCEKAGQSQREDDADVFHVGMGVGG